MDKGKRLTTGKLGVKSGLTDSKSQLGRGFYSFLRVHSSFMVFMTLPSIFINTFLMGQTESLDVTLIYNTVGYLFSAAGMLLAGMVIHWSSSRMVSLIGILLYNILYLQLGFFGTASSRYVLLLGATNGLAGAFYTMSYNSLLTEHTTQENRDRGFAVVCLVVSFINLAIPQLSGFLIFSVGGANGYYLVFALAFVIAVITAIQVLKLPKATRMPGSPRYRETIRYLLQNKAVFYGTLGQGCMGIWEGAFTFILSVLLYSLVKNEAFVGFNMFLSGGAAIVSYWIISRYIRIWNRIKFMKIAIFSLMGYAIFVIFQLNAVALLIFTVINSFFAGFISNSSFVTYLDAIQAISGGMEKRAELIAIKEVFLAVGRCSGILFILGMNRIGGGAGKYQAISLAVLISSQLLTMLLCKKTLILTKNDKQQEGEK